MDVPLVIMRRRSRARSAPPGASDSSAQLIAPIVPFQNAIARYRATNRRRLCPADNGGTIIRRRTAPQARGSVSPFEF
jgi:hypothetical protein